MNHIFDATRDVITCVKCRVAVPSGQVCLCSLRTQGPNIENVVRKTLTEETENAE